METELGAVHHTTLPMPMAVNKKEIWGPENIKTANIQHELQHTYIYTYIRLICEYSVLHVPAQIFGCLVGRVVVSEAYRIHRVGRRTDCLINKLTFEDENSSGKFIHRNADSIFIATKIFHERWSMAPANCMATSRSCSSPRSLCLVFFPSNSPSFFISS